MNFETCTSFKDLCLANIRYLKGELDRSPYCLGPICQETYSILDDLISMNLNGLLTTNSQPGCQIKDYTGRDYQQNAYITFICRIEKAYYILGYLKEYLGYTDRDACIQARLGHYPACDKVPAIHTPEWDFPIPDLHNHHLWKDLRIEYASVCIFDPIPTRNKLFSDLKNLVSTKDAVQE